MTIEEVKKLDIPKKPGSYQFYNEAGEIIYVGKAANLQSRVLSYWQKSTDHTPAKFAMLKQINSIKWIETDSEIEALLLESNFIKKYQPQFNVLLRDDKRFAYVKISLEDEIPGIFVTRKVDQAGRYFGPFVSVMAVKETLKTIRKIWPYCATRKTQKKACFYHQIGRCMGICGNVVGKKEYLEKVIKPIILFFEGKKEKIIKNYEIKIRDLEKKIKKLKEGSDEHVEVMEELGYLKFQVRNMKHVLEHANILGLVDKYATDIVELAKVLGLPKTPDRIEGYDISNIFGREAVGSMVVFTDGEEDKNEYRKFKIKVGQGEASDVRMLREVLERRFAHSENPLLRGVAPKATGCVAGVDVEPLVKSSPSQHIPLSQEGDLILPFIRGGVAAATEGWTLPDLIVIDGGKPQLNVAAAVLKKHKLKIPLIAISKGNGLRSGIAPDKLFFPGEKKPLSLPLSSPALHLIKRVRDEAHRFAITYHRNLRSKEWLNK
ncbi:MAG: Excinuclease ABC C subunit domain protein [Parcubacteria group bacterium GW2011_GWE2_39_37]|uniref:Excinuclease ABC C subunit domain protein n=1 Tax=Candidatus Falkowbacteria bacterium GW2011_GWF2_39_8 TaxID=1618642 RepID=A0A0G0SE64_9BACT|nr:MAG: Excinuclease ABC C subunit domain protein [Parcubacteria group bacterium GW2011_GWE2_39_37]KKR33005.1 MAG: Excinuclease ABC C subunit domain protein [Candidatus Falkowbacteria bacterium GW2011_GWF2_39_8]